MKKFFVLIMFLMVTVKSAESLPERYDLRDYGRITSVKNQEKLAVCGTFASLGAMESNYLKDVQQTTIKIPVSLAPYYNQTCEELENDIEVLRNLRSAK